ncbi:MAG: SDR family oxidoreductase, partial [Woeseiaceae bacterium]|nr:SDR family oxidoreductase [Woeseiaceae bacterium]
DVRNSGVEQHYRSVRGISGVFADLTSPAKQVETIQAVVDRLGGIDILVCDFPVYPESPISEPGDALDKLLGRRADLTLAICNAALPHLQKSPAGRIINIGFLRSVFAADGKESLRKAEANLADITRALAAESGDFGITANYVQPGAIMTPVSREVFRKHKGLRDYCIANSAARRLGEPVDVAKVVLFLATDESMFVNGTGIVVDGGRTDV